MSCGEARAWTASLLLVATLLAACGDSPALLSRVAATPAVLTPTGRQPTEPIQLGYILGQAATVTLRLQGGPDNVDLLLRPPALMTAGPHFVLFNGVMPLAAPPGPTATGVARVLPNGRYRFVVQAAGQQTATELEIRDAQTALPGLDNLQVYPATISPNSDAVDDVAQITYRLNQTSTTAVTLQGTGGPPITVLAPEQVPAGEQKIVFNGQDLLGRPVANGVYMLTVRTEDHAGNAVEARRPLTVTASGAPNIALLAVQIDPPALMLGGQLHVRLVVQNTGEVPLRTQGPDSGYTYTTNDSYASINGGRYVDRAGLWRVGLDWEGNTGGAPYRYPYRWGFGRTLPPGARATIDGYVTILKQERTMWFYAGILQEGISIAADRLGRTPVSVSW